MVALKKSRSKKKFGGGGGGGGSTSKVYPACPVMTKPHRAIGLSLLRHLLLRQCHPIQVLSLPQKVLPRERRKSDLQPFLEFGEGNLARVEGDYC